MVVITCSPVSCTGSFITWSGLSAHRQLVAHSRLREPVALTLTLPTLIDRCRASRKRCDVPVWQPLDLPHVGLKKIWCGTAGRGEKEEAIRLPGGRPEAR